MLRTTLRAGLSLVILLATSWAGTVNVASPANGATVTAPTRFVASAVSSAPVTAMRIYVDNQAAFTSYSDKIDTSLSLASGTRSIVVQAWDSTGAVSKSLLTVNVAAAPAAGVSVAAPANGATVSSPVRFTASATAPNPITGMRIYVDTKDSFATGNSSLDTSLALSPGWRNVVVQAWDSTGAVYKQTMSINVAAPASGVTIAEPANNASVNSPARFVASAKSATSAPITAMKIYVDGQDSFSTQGPSLDATLQLAAGTRQIVIQAWNSTGEVYKQAISVNVAGAAGPQYPSYAKVFSDIEHMPNWDHCTVCAGIDANGPIASYAMTQGISNPSMDGNAAEFWLGGSTPYANALWWKQLGANPAPKNFIYELYFYITQPQYAQALEFDLNHTTGGKRYIFGTQCNLKDGGVWDIWDGLGVRWIHTNIPCTSVPAYQWNHLAWEFKRDDHGNVTFLTLTFNGQKHYVNKTYGSLTNWANDLNVAFQMDGDYAQHQYKAWLDNVTLIHW